MLGLLAGLGFGIFAGSPQVRHVEGWRLAVRRDSFAQTVLCSLSKPHASVNGARLIWRLGSGVDTSSALYRIDEGPPRASDFFTLPASANLSNPSDGRIPVDLTALSAARRVSAEVRANGRLYTLGVGGLDKALLAAKSAGCDRFTAPAQ